MTPEETHSIIESMATAYPPIRDYLAKIADWPATKATWCKMLAAVSYEDAQAAVDRMIGGKADAPTAPWEIGNLPAWVRAVAGRIADDRAKAQRVASVEAESSKRAAPKSKTNFGQYYRIALAAGACKARGEITAERNAEIMRHGKHMHLNHETEPIEVPDDIRHEYDHPSPILKRP